MQTLLFLREPLDRLASSRVVRAGVDLLAELPAGGFQLAERLVLFAQIDVPGHQIGLRDLHRGLGSALGFRVRRQTRTNRRAVVPRDLDDLRVADRDPGDVVDGDRLLVVRKDIGRDPADPAEGGVQTCGDRRQRLVPDRDDDAETGPGHPCAEQRGLAALDHRPVAEVVLNPEPRLGHPRPVDPAQTGPELGFRLGHRAAGGAFPTGETHRGDPLVDHVRADTALRADHQLLDLRQIIVDRASPVTALVRMLTGRPHLHITGHRVVVAPGQLGRRTVTACEVVCLKDLHDLPAVLHPLQRRRAGLLGASGEKYLAVRGDSRGHKMRRRWPPPGSLRRPPSPARGSARDERRGRNTVAVSRRPGRWRCSAR